MGILSVNECVTAWRLDRALESAGDAGRDVVERAGAGLGKAAEAASEQGGALLDATRDAGRQAWQTTRQAAADVGRDAGDAARHAADAGADGLWQRGLEGVTRLWRRLVGDEAAGESR